MMGMNAGPPAEVIIGIDVGTTAAKVSAFGLGSQGSRWRHTAVREYPLLRPHPGWEVQDPDVLITAMIAALRDVAAACAGARVVALGLSSAMHGLIGLDAASQPLTPLITWADSRARDVAAELRATGAATELHQRSGTPVHSMSPLTKLIWFARFAPEEFARVRHWIGLKDWLILALTGTLATELSTASGSGLLDLASRTWSASSLVLAGIRSEQLPPVLPTTAALGLASPVAQRVGLSIGTPVILGAGDGPLGNLGTGALGGGVASLSIGTSGAVRATVSTPRVDSSGALFCYAITDDDWVIGGAISNGGSVLRWAGDVFGPPTAGTERSRDEDVLALASSVPPGSDGLIALPLLMAERAPLWDPTLTGAFLGVRNLHTRGHFIRACVEGVAQQLWSITAQLDAVTPVQSLRATGGVFRSPLWRQVLSDVLDRPLTVTDGAEGSALGACALGLVGLGRAPTLLAAVEMLSPAGGTPSEPTRPDPSAAATYREARAAVTGLLASLDRLTAFLAPLEQRNLGP